MTPRSAVQMLLPLAAVATLTGCGADNTDLSQSLEDAVAALPGVVAAEHDYRRNDGTNGSKLTLEVTMADDATHEQVIDAVWRTQRAFGRRHAEDDPEAEFRIGDDTISIGSASARTTEPAMFGATQRALDVLPHGQISVFLGSPRGPASTVTDSDEVWSDFRVVVPEPGPLPVLETTQLLEGQQTRVGPAAWTVTSVAPLASEISSTTGFPGAVAVSLHATLTDSLRRELGPDALESSAISVTDVGASTTLARDTDPALVERLLARHLDALVDAPARSYSLDLSAGGPSTVEVDADQCGFSDTDLGARLEDALGAECARVSRALPKG